MSKKVAKKSTKSTRSAQKIKKKPQNQQKTPVEVASETAVILETSDGVLEEVTKDTLEEPVKPIDEGILSESNRDVDSQKNVGDEQETETTQVDLVESQKPTFGARLHTLNVRRPWLKVVLLILLAGGVAFGVEELLRYNVGQPVGTPTEVTVESTPDVPGENTLGEPDMSESEQGVTEEPEAPEEQSPTETPATSQPTTNQSASVQPSTSTTSTASVQPSTGRRLVALTFDDGPSAAQTPRLLQILRDKNVKATFFVVGNMAQRSPDLLRQEEAEGHEVASHTMTHANLNRSTVEGIKWEAAAINGVFTDILGHGPSLTRPPYGNLNSDARTYINQPFILWTVDPEDWKYKNAATVRQNVVSKTFDGAIILLHDIHATTVDAVAGIIDDLRAAGYEFMTVSELAAARGVVMQKGVAYGSFRP